MTPPVEMSTRRETEGNAMRSFGKCLTFHLKRGTRPDGKQKEWSNAAFAVAVGRGSGGPR